MLEVIDVFDGARDVAVIWALLKDPRIFICFACKISKAIAWESMYERSYSPEPLSMMVCVLQKAYQSL